ncbi:type I-F CRISPR-associated endonuclease Cas1f [Leminorella grimontii]|uniref:type I-F CRISPR-associated endonuclease Cas1f n=1 Tax=Leminorella grimontii TaxID=82981 RepID=UPI00321F698D
MDDFSPSDLKTILHSKRANLYYLEHCRILVNGGRVEYVTDAGKSSLYWNIPIANTTSILLGTGTSITQAAVRELAKAGVLIGFCGGGGTPLFSANEVDCEVVWFTPQSEYRPTEYLQRWIRFWFDDEKRLAAAKMLQLARLSFVEACWPKHGAFAVDGVALGNALRRAREDIAQAPDVTHLLTQEGRLTKTLYALAANAVRYGSFQRVKGGGGDTANRLLDHGNYLAYGLGATATWVLGLPHGVALLHGKTRRGGLVFDAADLVKDALILPQAFISASLSHEDREFRQSCIQTLTTFSALDFMIDSLKQIADEMANVGDVA